MCAALQTAVSGQRSHLPVCFSMSSIFVWNTGSTASTLTPVPDCGIANTSTTCAAQLA